MVLDNLMYDLGMIAQLIVNEMNLPDERTKATAYIGVVTNLVDSISEMIKELNKFGVEKIRSKYSVKEAAPNTKSSIII